MPLAADYTGGRMVTWPIAIAALMALAPYLAAAFFREWVARVVSRLPPIGRILAPCVLGIPYALVTAGSDQFRWGWLALYCLLPVALAALLLQARRIDPQQKGNWRDFLILLSVGLAVDLRWLEPAWPAHMAVFSKVLLLDAGIYGFGFLRELEGVGFDLRLRGSDFGIALREFLFYAPMAIVLSLSMGFLHFHAAWPAASQWTTALLFTFFFIAVPEELFFRGWMQNLLEKRCGRYPALFVTAVVFGLSHWNKRTADFNWRYVLMAAIAGVFYGRAWRQGRRVGASALTHAGVDTVWSLWLR